MKNIAAYMLFPVLLLAGCTRLDTDQLPIRFHAVAEAAVETRVDDSISQDSCFDANESIAVFVTDLSGVKTYETPETYTVGDVTTVDGRPGNELQTANAQFFPNSSISIHAYYPYGSWDGSATGITTFSVATDQTDIADYKNSDLMAAKVDSQSPTANAINLSFTHKLSRVAVYVDMMNGFSANDILSIKMFAKAKTDFNKANLSLSLTSENNDRTEVTLFQGADHRLGACIVPPQTLGATYGTTDYLIKVELTDDRSLYFRNSSPFQMQSGYTYLLRLNCSTYSITFYIPSVNVWIPTGDINLAGELLQNLLGKADIAGSPTTFVDLTW